MAAELTEEEVMAQGIQIFNAGFETTASTLQFLTYSLATNPAVQEKLYTEIMEVVGDVSRLFFVLLLLLLLVVVFCFNAKDICSGETLHKDRWCCARRC